MIHVTPDLVTFTDVEGDRTTIKLHDLFPQDPTRATPEERAALLNWGCFFQLVEISQATRQINQRLGTVDIEKGEGSGLSGLVAQEVVSMIEVSEKLGALVQAFEDIEKRAAAAPPSDPATVLAQARDLVGGLMGDLTGAARPGGNSGSGEAAG